MEILTMVNFYLPGCKGGGPIQSVANMANLLGENFYFKIITTDRDHNDPKRYPEVRPGEWQEVGRARVLYVARGDLSFLKLRRILNSTKYDVLYMNSLFDAKFTIQALLLRWAQLIRRTPVVVAPRGELSPGALAIKPFKKRLYLAAVQVWKLYDNVVWHASTPYEKAQIQQWFGCNAIIGQAPIMVAPDLISPLAPTESLNPSPNKERGRLRIVFVSRISPKKNLIGALRCLSGLRGIIEFDIYGHVDNETYWEECRKVMQALPSNVHVRYLGALSHQKVVQEMAQYDLFFLPTLGENFGHVIVESFSAGCPVLISDQTPWRHLDSNGAGWDLPVDQVSAFQDVLQRCIDMDDEEHGKLRKAAVRMAEAVAQDDSTLLRNRELFLRAHQIES